MSPKIKRMIALTITYLLVFIFSMAGITKLIGIEMQMKNIRSWGFPDWYHYPIGLVDVVLGILIALPKTRKRSFLLVYPWTIVAVYTHIQAVPAQTNMIGTPIAFAVLATVAFLLTEKK